MANTINWFEIPTKNINRAKVFYETILGAKMEFIEMMGMEYAFFATDMKEGSLGGCLIKREGHEPSHKGVLIYLNGGDDLINPLNKVEGAGGKIILAKTAIGGNGFMAYIEDTEGNKIGLHSRS